MKLSENSLNKLKGVNSKLVDIVNKVVETYEGDFIITEGVRTLERQKQLVLEKKSRTLMSNHLTGRAIDLAPLVNGKVSWDMKDFVPMANAMKAAAKELNITLVWGGDWKTFIDGPHFELGSGE